MMENRLRQLEHVIHIFLIRREETEAARLVKKIKKNNKKCVLMESRREVDKKRDGVM